MIWCVCCFIAFISCLETEKPPLGAVLDGPRLPYDLQWNKPNVDDIKGSWKQISFFSESSTAQQESVCWHAICVFYLSAATTWGALIFPLLQIPKQLRPESPHFPDGTHRSYSPNLPLARIIGWLSTLILSLFTPHTGSCSSYVCSSDNLKCKSWNGKCWLFGKRVKPALNLSAIGPVLVNLDQTSD